MKILIDDGMQVKVGTGIGKYSLYLYRSLKKYLQDNDTADLVEYEEIGSQKVKRLKYIFYINSNNYVKKSENYDVVHCTNYLIPFRRAKNVKYVVTIHDLASFIHPDSLPGLYRLYSRFVVGYALKHADAVLTVSRSVKKEIEEYFPKSAHKVTAIYPGHYSEIEKLDTEECFFDEELLKPLNSHPFFLFVGTIEKRKNISLMLKSFFELKKKFSSAKDYFLVLAGRPGFGYEEFREMVSNSSYRESIIFTGYVKKDTINKLYNKASAYLFPTVYEGFGSTQLECMACHTPLILSDITTNREISEQYGCFFDIREVNSFVGQMYSIVNNEYNQSEKNLLADQIMEKFDWSVLIDEYICFYKDIIDEQ